MGLAEQLPVQQKKPSPSENMMRVRKRDGRLVPVDVTRIVQRVTECSEDLREIDPHRVAIKTISGLYDGATTKELDNLAIQTAALLISEEPQYSYLASRLLSVYIDKEVQGQGIKSFTEAMEYGHRKSLIHKGTLDFVKKHGAELEKALRPRRNEKFQYFGLRTVYDRYLLKSPDTRQVFETPQYFFMRVACGLSQSVLEAIELYTLISKLDYLPSTPTLFNSGTLHPQMSSCYLLDSPKDDLRAIYKKYQDVALLSKFAGGIGLAYHRVRSHGSLIQGTNGHSNGVVPWLKTLDSSVAAVNQGGKRKGACCVYLETWHGDIEEFLELRDNTGDEAKRTHNLNIANWVPDLFMKRVEEGGVWSLFDPKEQPQLTDTYGEEFENLYVEAERQKKFVRQLPARELYSRMMRTLAQTGNGWMTFKDHCNLKSNQTLEKGNVIHLSNLCTEIVEVTKDSETAVCNLGSVNLAHHVTENGVNYRKIRETVQTAVGFLDRVVDVNFYPIGSAANSNHKWRPVGLGVMGLQDVFFKLGLSFDSEEATSISTKIQEEIYYAALKTSCDLAEKHGAHGNFHQTRVAQGLLQFDLWGVKPKGKDRWAKLRARIKECGLRNSLIIAIAPTATIASIAGCYESIEPQISNLFKRETLSGEFLQINHHLVRDLKKIGLWTQSMRDQIKSKDGSIQSIKEIPDSIRSVYRTAWEIPMKALIDMAADRGAYIDQSQSLNLFMENPNIGKLSSMYMYAWKKGLKTTYYLRSRAATSINKATVSLPSLEQEGAKGGEAVACSLENPELCEACQ